MVLELLVVPERCERRPGWMFFVGFVYASMGVLLGLWVFAKYASVASVFITTIPLVVIMYRAIDREELKDLRIYREILLLREHMHILWFFLYLFVGMVSAYAFWFTLLPADVGERAFQSQIDAIDDINNRFMMTGAAVGLSGRVFGILDNNIRVWAFCLLFSLVYGAGAIFLLTWNASTLGVAIGNTSREMLQRLGEYGSVPSMIQYFTVIPVGLGYMLHGIPEITSYFLCALAGGIVSQAAVGISPASPKFQRILRDALSLAFLSLGLLIVAALIEVYITPIVFSKGLP